MTVEPPTFSILAARRTFRAFSWMSSSDFMRSSRVVKGLVYPEKELLRRFRTRNLLRVSSRSISGGAGGGNCDGKPKSNPRASSGGTREPRNLWSLTSFSRFFLRSPSWIWVDVRVESEAVSSIVDCLENGALRWQPAMSFRVSTTLSSSDKSMNDMGEGIEDAIEGEGVSFRCDGNFECLE